MVSVEEEVKSQVDKFASASPPILINHKVAKAIANNFEGINVSHDRRLEKGHHRTEKRLVWAVPLSEFGGLYKQEQWSGLQTIVMVERTRHLWNKVTHEVQFYLSSLPADASYLGHAIRTHWGIENQVHWTKGRNFAVRPCEGLLR